MFVFFIGHLPHYSAWTSGEFMKGGLASVLPPPDPFEEEKGEAEVSGSRSMMGSMMGSSQIISCDRPAAATDATQLPPEEVEVNVDPES